MPFWGNGLMARRVCPCHAWVPVATITLSHATILLRSWIVVIREVLGIPDKVARLLITAKAESQPLLALPQVLLPWLLKVWQTFGQRLI